MTDKPAPASLKKFIPLAALALLMALAWAAGLPGLVDWQTLQDNKDGLLDLTRAHPVAAAAGFAALYALCVALSLPVATFLTLLGGFLFGQIAGTALVVVAAAAGATVIFLIARSALGETLRAKAGTVYLKIADGLRRDAVSYLLFLRLVPLFPFWLVNIAPALVGVPVRVFVATTIVGIIPGSFVYVNLGTALGSISSLDGLVSGQTLLAFTLLGLFAMIPMLYRRFKDRIKKDRI